MRKIKFGYDEFITFLKILYIAIAIVMVFSDWIIPPILRHMTMPKKVIEKIDMDMICQNIEKLEDLGATKSISKKEWEIVFYDEKERKTIGTLSFFLYDEPRNITYRQELKGTDISYEYSFYEDRDIFKAPSFYMTDGKVEIRIEGHIVYGSKRYDIRAFNLDKELINILKAVNAYSTDN